MFDKDRDILLTIMYLAKNKETSVDKYVKSMLQLYSMKLQDELKEANIKKLEIEEKIELLEHIKEKIEEALK